LSYFSLVSCSTQNANTVSGDVQSTPNSLSDGTYYPPLVKATPETLRWTLKRTLDKLTPRRFTATQQELSQLNPDASTNATESDEDSHSFTEKAILEEAMATELPGNDDMDDSFWTYPSDASTDSSVQVGDREDDDGGVALSVEEPSGSTPFGIITQA
jgi:hypothetical protein